MSLETDTQQQQPFYGPLSGTTRVSWYQKKHSPTHHPDHHPIFISFFHLPRSIASSLFKLHAWQSFCTTSLIRDRHRIYITNIGHVENIKILDIFENITIFSNPLLGKVSNTCHSWPKLPFTLDNLITTEYASLFIMCRHFITLRSWLDKLECGPMPKVMAALPNISGTLCSTPQSMADAHY